MNSNSNSQKSQKAEKMSGRPRRDHDDSNMQSDQHEHASSRPMRVAAMRPENQEFKVAGEDFGGLRQKVQPGTHEGALTDEKGFALPLDKVVVQEITAGRKGSEPINHLHQSLEHHVKVGLNRPSLTIFSSMGGGRNTSSTEIDFGGAGGNSKGANKDNGPKEFEYREEDFQPLSPQSNLKQHGSQGVGSGRIGSWAMDHRPVQHKSQHADSDSSYLGLTPSFFKTQPSAPNDNATPGVHLHHLAALHDIEGHHAPATRQSGTQQQQQQNSHDQLQSHSRTVTTHRPLKDSYQADDESEDPIDHHLHQHHIVGHPSSTRRAQPAHHEPLNAPVHLVPAPVKHSQQAQHKSAAPANASAFPSTKLSKKQASKKHQQQREHPDRQQDHAPASAHHAPPEVHPDPMHRAHAAPIYHSPSATAPAPAPAQAHHSHAPVHQAAAPAHHSVIHQSAMPPVHHDAPAHHSAPEHHFPAEHIAPVHRQAPVVAHPDPMHLAHSAPVYHAPSSTGAPASHGPTGASHHAPTHIETIHMPYHAPAAGTSAPAYGFNAPHGAHTVIQSATAIKPDSAAAPVHQVPVSTHKPVLSLGKSHDEPVHQTPVVPVLSHADAAGLHAASYPSFAHHAPEPALLPTHPPAQRGPSEVQEAHTQHPQNPAHDAAVAFQHHAPTQAHPHAATGVPKHAKKPSKRERKAAKKHDASKRQSVMESISSALVGRRKNSVSTPVMRLNEIFDEPDGAQSTQEHGPSAAVASAAAVAGGIRTLLGSIHMPAMISRHPSEAHAIHSQEAPKLGATSAHGNATASHHAPEQVPSKAAALKTPRLDLSLFPEEQANYPRGEASKHENPAHPNNIVDVTEINYRAHPVPQHQLRHDAAALKTPKLDLSLFPEEQANYPRGEASKHENPAHPNNIVDVTEIHDQAHPEPQHHQHKQHHGAISAAAIGAAAIPLAAKSPMILNLHHNQQQAQTHSAHDSSTAPAAHAQMHHSTAAALRSPKVPLGLFPEEEEDYPRGADYHHENRPAGPQGHPVAIKEIQLDAVHQHAHHDLHPTMTEHHGVIGAAAIGAAATPLAAKSPMVLNLHQNQQQAQTHSAHGSSTAPAAHVQMHHSTAAALRSPKVPLGLFPEEEEDYPRGADYHHENRPAGPQGHPVVIKEIQLDAAHQHGHHDLHSTMTEHHGAIGAAAIGAAAIPLAAKAPMILNLHQNQQQAQTHSAHGSSTAPAAHVQMHHSTAAALRSPKVPLGLFPEEEEDYPRGADYHHENRPAGPQGHPVVIKEIQLDAAHQHGHHDLHPTMTETVTEVVEQGLEELSHSLEGASAAVEHGLEELGHGIEGIWTMLEGIHLPAIPSLAAPAATAAVAATAARRAAAPATHSAPVHASVHAPVHTAPTPSNTMNSAKEPEMSALPLMYGTPVSHAAPSTAPTKREHHVQGAAPVHAIASTYFAAPIVPVYIEPTVHSGQEPIKAASASSQHQLHQAEGHKFTPSEHHSRGMEIHGLSDEENYYSAKDIHSPALASGSTNLLINRKYENVSVLPPTQSSAHGSHASTSYYAAPVAATALASAAIPAAVHHHQAAAPASAARIPIAQPPTELKTAPKVEGQKTSQAHHAAARVPHVSQAPTQQHRTAAPIASAHHHSASATILAAAPLMGAAAAGVKDDDLLIMEATEKKAPIHAASGSTFAMQQQGYSARIPQQAPIQQQHAQAPKSSNAPIAPGDHVVMMKKTTTTTVLPANVPLPNDSPVLAPTPGVKSLDTTVIPTLRGENIVVQATAAPKPNADLSQRLGNVAAPAAAAVAAASAYAASTSSKAPLASAPKLKLSMHEQDVPKPTPLQAHHPMIPATQNIKTTSKDAETVANAPRPAIPHQQGKPAEVQAIKTTTTSTVQDLGAKPVAIEVKTSKPVTVEMPSKPIVAAAAAAPIVAAHEIQQPAVQMQKTTTTTTPAPASASVQANRPVIVETHHVQQPTAQMQKTTTAATTTGPAPVPAARPAMAAAAAIPIAAAAASTLNKSSTTTTTAAHQQQAPTVPQQQIQQQPLCTSATTGTTETTTVECPAGYQGALPVIHSGESIIWVKKVSTTEEFYDSEEEDDQKLDEFGHRKDRDVSLHLPYSVTHASGRRTSSGSMSSGNSQGLSQNVYNGANAPQQQGQGQSIDYDLQNQARAQQQQQYAGISDHNANRTQSSGRGPAM
ncbi:hypothetical protein EMPS_06421 [Entomortierella parvispora]|uniref:Uncharacterized protein n=1 Tax=Entomortierella parvispora TaxID=205924 RepID=A0A9P3LXG6_9FUNG|nr:hypothetical protein EMPS_06421 [Entomortierella parvispora]